MILEVGDMVKVRENINRFTPNLTFGFNEEMEEFRGRYVTIARIDFSKDFQCYDYRIEEDGLCWHWHIDMFDLNHVIKGGDFPFERLAPKTVFDAYKITGYLPEMSKVIGIFNSRMHGRRSADPFTAIIHSIFGVDKKERKNSYYIIQTRRFWPYKYVNDFMLGWHYSLAWSDYSSKYSNPEYCEDGAKARAYIDRHF